MTLHAALRHVTHYRYDREIELGAQVVRLRPAPHCRTPIVSYALSVSPPNHFLNWQQDPHGNYLARLVFPERTESLTIAVDLVAEMVALNPFDFFLEPHAENFPFQYEPSLAADLAPFLRVEKPGPKLGAWLEGVSKKPVRTMDFLIDLNRRLANEIEYVVRLEPGVQTPEETLELARGSCRDSGWLLVHLLRHLGIAARFVSGYLIQLTADQESLDGPNGPAADFCDLHAWAEAYVPGAGWIGLDATSGLMAGEGHLPLACTPEPRSAAPISGTLDECEVTFDVTMEVTRIVESARVTKPYTEAQWSSIDAAGKAVDARLKQGDVRLTMGGEPTFVSLDDNEGDEWNTAAVGPTKAVLAADLVARLRDRFAPNGALQFGQGKWYPGEPLPRWSYGLFWRDDAEPMWQRPDLIALEPRAETSFESAQTFAHALCDHLGVDNANALPVYEDPFHLLAQEHRLPVDDDASLASLKDPQARLRLARGLERGLSAPVAIVLPVQPWQSVDGRRWRSEKWTLRAKHLFLAPGDSPAGLRLPLESLPDVAEVDRFPTQATVPFAPQPPFPERAQHQVARAATVATGAALPKNVRTALTVEPRDGFLYVFLPPLPDAEDYVALLEAVETTAAALSVPVRLEGYEPPADARIRSLRVTPDPGVIEVNVAPSASWDELVSSTEILYEEARLSRLTTEKFMLDGKHAGTGGGNHVVLGGKTPSDSPFLRRPDLLKSLLGYFINHPSLSFLFSGMFIGPTSQAPRIDQARDDALYELELAFAQVPAPGEGDAPVPWMVDRIFRDVLVDVTGNTHRTEICIDKLFSPDSATGRQGLVELRAFEMPPHARMGLSQALLVRALVARLWERPYVQPPVHWGTQLHDRFLLPHFVWQDFVDVIDDLIECDLPVDASWFLPHYEFRFPRVGTVRYREIALELRTALEPWHVTGEDGAPGGTARYVDSSLERLQVSVTGFIEERYAVTCNGRRVPLTSTKQTGTYVAGVRYRAWQPPRCLHPLLGVDAPLHFDIVDKWTGRSVAGCTYHVGHPGGRSHEEFPVNALEAEGRRLGRFSTLAREGAAVTFVDEERNPAFPFTLDLRRKARP